MTPALELKSLTKRYGHVTAVDQLSLTIAPGEIVGLLGPNGAGKTTTVKMTTGLCLPTSGSASVFGFDLQRDPVEAKRRFGYIPDRPYLYERLTGAEYLEFIARLYRVPRPEALSRARECLELFELSSWQDELIESYSHGMRQKLVLTGALIHQPPLLIIDEPMVGLDPKGAKIVKEIFKTLAAKGVGLLLSTHSMELVEVLCHRIAILTHGTLKAFGTFEELKRQSKERDVHLEDLFLKLTGSPELSEVVRAIS